MQGRWGSNDGINVLKKQISENVYLACTLHVRTTRQHLSAKREEESSLDPNSESFHQLMKILDSSLHKCENNCVFFKSYRL